MLKLPEQALNIGDIGTYLRPRFTARELPNNNAKLLRKPITYKAGIEPLENSYLEDLIQKNIVVHKGSEHNILTSQYHAADARAIYNSLSCEYKKKFLEIVKALELDKENWDMLKGMIIAGGEIRVVASSGDVMVVNVIARLLGIKLKEFDGVSAGGFQAAGQAARAPNSFVFANTVDTDFVSMIRKRTKLKDWIRQLIKEGFYFNTGREVDSVTNKLLEEELGTILQVLISENLRFSKLPLVPLPTFKTDLFPSALERFGLDPQNYDLAELASLSANLAGLFFKPWDMTFDDGFIKDAEGKKHYCLDPGLLGMKYKVPIEPLEKGIKQYLNGEIKKPPYYFVIGNQLVDSSVVPEEILCELSKNFTFTQKLCIAIGDFIDWLTANKGYIPTIQKIGAQRAYTEAICVANDPFKTSRIPDLALLNSGDLAVPAHEREVLICANVPRAIDDLHKNLVDKEYVSSNGKAGKSPMQLYKDDIDKTFQKDNSSSSIFTARQKIQLA